LYTLYYVNDGLIAIETFSQEGRTMDEQETKRTRRTPEERAAGLDAKIEMLRQTIAKYEDQKNAAMQEYDNKIAAVTAKIEALEQQKTELLTPKPRKPRVTKKQKTEAVIRKAIKAGLSPSEVAERLGVELDL